jgi:hypothetical protein
MKTIHLILVVSLTSILTFSYVTAGLLDTRECRDPAGRVLYRVRQTSTRGEEVVAASGVVVGTVKNGEVRDTAGRVLAYGGDAGLLYCLTHR